jgi:hypothetical protein
VSLGAAAFGVLLLVTGASVSCGDEGSLPADATTGVVATPTAVASTSEATPTPPQAATGTPALTPPPAPPVVRPHPPHTRTGVASVDAVIDALLAGPPGAFEAFFVDTPSPCVANPMGIHNPPACPPGVGAGTLLPVFRAMAGEAVWPESLPGVVENFLAQPHPLLAVYRGASEEISWLPPAEYAIVAHGYGNSPSGGHPVEIRVQDGHVNGIRFHCRQTAEECLAGVTPDRFILPPLR